MLEILGKGQRFKLATDCEIYEAREDELLEWVENNERFQTELKELWAKAKSLHNDSPAVARRYWDDEEAYEPGSTVRCERIGDPWSATKSKTHDPWSMRELKEALPLENSEFTERRIGDRRHNGGDRHRDSTKAFKAYRKDRKGNVRFAEFEKERSTHPEPGYKPFERPQMGDLADLQLSYQLDMYYVRLGKLYTTLKKSKQSFGSIDEIAEYLSRPTIELTKYVFQRFPDTIKGFDYIFDAYKANIVETFRQYLGPGTRHGLENPQVEFEQIGVYKPEEGLFLTPESFAKGNPRAGFSGEGSEWDLLQDFFSGPAEPGKMSDNKPEPRLPY
jgi:hypothetical protein